MHFVSKCEMWFKNAISDFFFCRNIIVNSFSWSCLIISSFMFRLFDSNFFEVINAWRELIKSWRKRLIKHERYLIKSDKRRLIKLDETYLVKIDKRHFIKSDDDLSSNLMNNVSTSLMIVSHQILTSDILSNLMMIFHQTWWRYLIKLNENFVCSSLMSVFEWQAKVCE